MFRILKDTEHQNLKSSDRLDSQMVSVVLVRSRFLSNNNQRIVTTYSREISIGVKERLTYKVQSISQMAQLKLAKQRSFKDQ